MIQQKSENGIVPQDHRKEGTTKELGSTTPWGGKAVSVSERWTQPELPFDKADKSGDTPESSAVRAGHLSPTHTDEVPKTKSYAEKEPTVTMEWDSKQPIMISL